MYYSENRDGIHLGTCLTITAQLTTKGKGFYDYKQQGPLARSPTFAVLSGFKSGHALSDTMEDLLLSAPVIGNASFSGIAGMLGRFDIVWS